MSSTRESIGRRIAQEETAEAMERYGTNAKNKELLEPARERRIDYEMHNPEALMDNEAYAQYAKIFIEVTKSPFSSVENEFDAHYQVYLDTLDFEEIINEYKQLRDLIKYDRAYQDEMRVCTKEFLRRSFMSHDGKYRISLEMRNVESLPSQGNRRGSAFPFPHLRLESESEELIIPGYTRDENARVQQILLPGLCPLFGIVDEKSDISPTRHWRNMAPFIAPRAQEQVYRTETMENAFYEYRKSQGYGRETFESSAEHLNVETIVATMDKYISYHSNIRYMLLPSGLEIFDRLFYQSWDEKGFGKESFEMRLKGLSPEEKLQFEIALGNTLGMLAKRSCALPEDLQIDFLEQILKNKQIKSSFDKLISLEADFWGKTFDPIRDAKAIEIYIVALNGPFHSLDEKMRCVEFLEKDFFSLDLTRCNDRISEENLAFTNHEEYSDPTQAGYGMYFGVTGGYRNWGTNCVIVQNAPLQFLQGLDGSMTTIPTARFAFPKEAMMPNAKDYYGIILDGRQGVLEEPSDYAARLSDIPMYNLVIHIPRVISETFEKYFPGTEIVRKNVTIAAHEVELPFLKLPQIAKTSPLRVDALRDYFQFSNITWSV